jgi:hypothetical protein
MMGIGPCLAKRGWAIPAAAVKGTVEKAAVAAQLFNTFIGRKKQGETAYEVSPTLSPPHSKGLPEASIPAPGRVNPFFVFFRCSP